jgi:hypothetical protein
VKETMGRLIPRGAEQRAGRAKLAWHVLLTCLLLAAAPAAPFARGQTTESHYVSNRVFRIPFGKKNPIDPRIQEIILYFATGSEQTYQYVATARPSDGGFLFRAPTDGWYSFATQTRDRDGQLSPSDLRGVLPDIRVCVDTQKPVITVQQVPAQDGSPVAIEWSVQDDNFDDLRADYRSVSGGEWYPLILPRTAKGSQGWTPVVRGSLEVQLQAIDKAKNKSGPQSVTVKPGEGTPGAPPPNPGGPGNVMHVKSKTFQLTYQLDNETVGPSKVERVDIWRIHQGRDWQKCRETGTPEGPASVTVDETGRWGFRLIPRSGVGLAERDPQRGDTPDIWVEVDDQAPKVKITNVAVGQGPDSGTLTVTWTASDTFLAYQPITISYATDPKGRWETLAKNQPHSGIYTCKPQDLTLPYQFYLKIEAVDEAGNVGEDKWSQPVKVDLKIPRIKHIEVKAGDNSASAPATIPPSRHPAIPTTSAGGLGLIP